MKRLIETRFFGILADGRTKEVGIKQLEEAFYEFSDLCIGTSSAVSNYALLVRIITHTRKKLQTLQGKHLPPTEAGEKCSPFYSVGY